MSRVKKIIVKFNFRMNINGIISHICIFFLNSQDICRNSDQFFLDLTTIKPLHAGPRLKFFW